MAKKNEDAIRYNTSVFLHDLTCFNKMPLMSTMARKPNMRQSLRVSACCCQIVWHVFGSNDLPIRLFADVEWSDRTTPTQGFSRV
jgi:hypothetical protein